MASTIKEFELTSIVNSIFDPAAAFKLSDTKEFLGVDRQWVAVNDIQGAYLPYLHEAMDYVALLVEDGLLEAKASRVVETINEWFAQRGFSITLQQQPEEDTFYIGSIFEQLVMWLNPGDVMSIYGADGKTYPDGVFMSEGFRIAESSHNNQLFAVISTQDDKTMAFMAPLSTRPSDNDPTVLLTLAHNIARSAIFKSYGALHFPMAHVDVTNHMDWLKGMYTIDQHNRRARVTEAVQQSILKINEKGALTKSAFGVSIATESMPKKTFEINRPFLFWTMRRGIPVPTFAAYVDYEDWKNPGELS